MKTSELRRGNWINTAKGFVQVDIIWEDNYINPSILDGCLDLWEEKVEPIPLTHEILEKCGFVKGRKGLIELQCTNIDPKFDYWVVAQYDQIDGQGHLLQNLEIKYLHQLQNLIFALNGKELQIKLP